MLSKLADAMNRLAESMEKFPTRLGQELHVSNESFSVGIIVGVVAALLLVEIFRRK